MANLTHLANAKILRRRGCRSTRTYTAQGGDAARRLERIRSIPH